MVVEPKCGREMCSLISGLCECKLFEDEHLVTYSLTMS
jgi:hypothetical protein